MKQSYLITGLFCVFLLSGNIRAQQNDESKYWIYEDFSSILNDDEENVGNAIFITYSGNTTEVVNPFEGNGVNITIDGQHVIVNSTLTE